MINSICVIGSAGRMGGFHLKRLKEEHKYSRLKILGFDTANGDRFWPEAEAYIIATPPETHYWIAEKLLRFNKHILVEKPLTLKGTQAIELYTLALTRNRTLLAGHTQRYNPAFLEKEKLLIEQSEFEFVMDLPHKNNIKNIVFDLMIHEIELILYLTDSSFLDVEILDAQKTKDKVQATIKMGETKTILSVGYNQPIDKRYIVGKTQGVEKVFCDLKREVPNQKDALAGLHSRFLELTKTGHTPIDINCAIGAVRIAEQIQRKLFDG